MSEMPRDFTPETGGCILFVGGPRDGTYINIPPNRNALKVKEFTRSGRRDDFGKITDHDYLLESIWYGRSKTKWWIMLDESVRRKEPDLPRILAAERRALDKILPPAESCAVPMKPGPLSDDASKWRPWNEKAAPIPGIHFDGYL